MTDLLAKTDKRISELEQELKALLEFRAAYLKVAPFLQAEGGMAAPLTPPPPKGVPFLLNPEVRQRIRNNLASKALIKAAVSAIRDHGEPMGRREVHEALIKQGIVVEGTDPLKVLGTALWRAKDQIVSLEGFGYWPKLDPYPPASYDPLGDL